MINTLLPPIASFDAYIQHIRTLPILTPEEETSYAIKSKNDGCIESTQKLVIHNLRFVWFIVNKYHHYGIDDADLMQSGTIGLMKAIKNFDPYQGIRLVAYAAQYIKSEIHEFIISNWRTLKIATTKAQRKLFFNLRSRRKSTSDCAIITHDEAVHIATELDVSVDDVRIMEVRLHNQSQMSLDQEHTTGDGVAYTLHDIIAADQPTPEDHIEHLEAGNQADSLKSAIERLKKPRDRDIITRRYMKDVPDGLTEIAADYGISAERVRQIEEKVIKNLKKALMPA